MKQTSNKVALPASAMALAPHPKMSERYVQVNTTDIIALMEQEGFHVATATSASKRSGANLFGRHAIDFRLNDAQEIHGATPRVIFTNSHDGSSTAKAMAGIFRFVCSNGLVVGSITEQVVQRHSGDAARDLIDRMKLLAKNSEATFAKVDRWSRLQLTASQRDTYARMVGQLRWGDPHMFEPEELLKLRRSEDDAGDLWSTFNRLQENTVRGGLIGLSRSGRRSTSRPLTDIQRDLTFNADLWRLTEDVAASL